LVLTLLLTSIINKPDLYSRQSLFSLFSPAAHMHLPSATLAFPFIIFESSSVVHDSQTAKDSQSYSNNSPVMYALM